MPFSLAAPAHYALVIKKSRFIACVESVAGRDEALARVHHWLQNSGVHWALDAEHRAALGLPADAVALNRSKHHELVAVELLHGFAGELVDGALNPGFFGVNHEGAA